MNLEAKCYDSEGKEVTVPQGHVLVKGVQAWCTIPVEQYNAQLIYRPPSEESCSRLLSSKIALARRITEDAWGDNQVVKTALDS